MSPDMKPDVPPSQPMPCSVTGNETPELAVKVCAELLHALPPTVAFAVIVHTVPPKTWILMSAAPVTVAAVVLVAVATHGPMPVTVVVPTPRLFVHPLNVGGASAPAAVVVVATAPVAFVFTVTVQWTNVPVFVVSRKVP